MPYFRIRTCAHGDPCDIGYTSPSLRRKSCTRRNAIFQKTCTN
jgi:hypothetical protein